MKKEKHAHLLDQLLDLADVRHGDVAALRVPLRGEGGGGWGRGRARERERVGESESERERESESERESGEVLRVSH